MKRTLAGSRAEVRWQKRGLEGKVAITLIELLVVIAVIAILTAMLLPALTRAKSGTAMAFQKGGYDVDVALNGVFGVLLFSAALFAAFCILFSQRRHSARLGGSGGSQAAPPSAGSKPPPPDAGKPVPLKPRPRHHLVAAKDLPPSDKTHCFPKD